MQEFPVSSLHLFEHIFVLLKVVNHIVSLVFILTLEDVFSLLNHCSYYCVVDCIVNTVCAKDVRHKGSNYTLHLHLVLLFKFDDITEKFDEEIKSILIYLRHLLDKPFDLLHQQVVAIRASDLCKLLIELSWNKGCLHLK